LGKFAKWEGIDKEGCKNSPKIKLKGEKGDERQEGGKLQANLELLFCCGVGIDSEPVCWRREGRMKSGNAKHIREVRVTHGCRKF